MTSQKRHDCKDGWGALKGPFDHLICDQGVKGDGRPRVEEKGIVFPSHEGESEKEAMSAGRRLSSEKEEKKSSLLLSPGAESFRLTENYETSLAPLRRETLCLRERGEKRKYSVQQGGS